MPEEPGRLGQIGRNAGGRRDGAHRGAGAGRPDRRQHVRVHRRGPAREHRHRARARRSRRAGARLVVTGCMAERYGDELAAALPEVDQVAGFGVPVRRTIPVHEAPLPRLDLLNLPRPPATRPWAYVKIAEGCDRRCGFCAIRPSAAPSAAGHSTRSSSRWTSSMCAKWCWWRRTSRRTARTPRPRSEPGRSCRSWVPSPSGSTACGCCTSTRATSAIP